MTKRLTIALVALVAFVLVAVLPVAASTNYLDVNFGNGTSSLGLGGFPPSVWNSNWTLIYRGQSVFLGEQGLNISYATISLANPSSATLLWYSANTPGSGQPARSIAINPSSFFVDPATYGSYVGSWYVNGTPLTFGTAGPSQVGDTTFQNASLAIVIPDPSAQTFTVSVRDITQETTAGKVVNGGSVPQGNRLVFSIQSPYWVVAGQRNLTTIGAGGLTNGVLGFINIKIKNDQGATYSSLFNGSTTSLNSAPLSTYDQNINASLWYWGNTTGSGSGSSGSGGGPDQVANPASLANWVGYWGTDHQTVSGVFDYPAGTYTVSAEIRLNHMKDNYKDPSGADYTGRTVTAAATVTLVSDTVQIAANKDTVVRGSPFSTTVTGKPNTYYFLFLKGVSSLTGDPLILGSGNYSTAAPTIDLGQAGVYLNTSTTTIASQTGDSNDPVGNYTYMTGLRIQGDQPALFNANRYRAIIKLDDSGKRTISWSTTRLTKDQKFTVRVEYDKSRTVVDLTPAASAITPVLATGAPYVNVSNPSIAPIINYAYATTVTSDRKSDEVDVTVQKGTVTVVAAGDQNYYLGEEIKLSGTNTESKTTYLFFTGPNVGGTNGGSLLNPTLQVTQGATTNWVTADVLSDNTWSYKWQTQNIQIDAGTYTIYAVSDTQTKPSLANATYGTVSIVIKKPFVSATASQSSVAKGDNFFITGTAEGNPSQGVQIWMLGKNFVGPGTATVSGNIVGNTVTQTVNADGTFSYEVKKASTKDLATGQYFVVVQHPMYNNRLDIRYNTTTSGVENLIAPTINNAPQTVFYLGTTTSGAGSLQGSDAAEALVDAINSPNVDDTYTKLSVLIEQPTINVDPIPDHYVGDKFTITGTTNLAVGDNILVEVTSSSFKPTQKTQSGEFSGSSGTVQAVKGTGGANTWSFDIDASTFKPDEYLVKASAVEQDATGTALFNILEGTPVTATPTKAPTAAATPVATTAATPMATTAAPTPTPTQPGFGALVALIGLGAVAFLVVRRN